MQTAGFVHQVTPEASLETSSLGEAPPRWSPVAVQQCTEMLNNVLEREGRSSRFSS